MGVVYSFQSETDRTMKTTCHLVLSMACQLQQWKLHWLSKAPINSLVKAEAFKTQEQSRGAVQTCREAICYLIWSPRPQVPSSWALGQRSCWPASDHSYQSSLIIVLCSFSSHKKIPNFKAGGLLLPARNPRKDHLLNWPLILNASWSSGSWDDVASFTPGSGCVQRHDTTLRSRE